MLRVALPALVLVLAAAHAADAALSFNGTRCSCDVETFYNEGFPTSTFKVVSRCEKAFSNSPAPDTCDCQGIKSICVVNPTIENEGLKIVTGSNFLAGQCNHFCTSDEVSPGVCDHPGDCRDAPCPDKALLTKEHSTRRVVSGVSEECSLIAEVTTCTTQEICHCELSEPIRLTNCTALPEDPCRGSESFRRDILQTPFNGGNVCPSEQDRTTTSACDVTCNRDCEVSPYGDFSPCSTTCGPGTQTRSRDVTVNPRGSGAACPALTETAPCDLGPCMCTYSEFVNGPCSTTCGAGVLTQTRTITGQPVGVECTDPVEQEVPCVGQPSCPVDCVMSPYGPFSTCSATCGDPTVVVQTRTRSVLVSPMFGGAECGPTVETVPCDVSPCPVDCMVSAFGAFGACSALCGPGLETRTRVVTRAAAHGGAACPALTESRACEVATCMCDLGAFRDFSACSEVCGVGLRSRVRDVVALQTENAICGNTQEDEECNERECAQHCAVGPFTSFSPCSEECGGGRQSRSRSVVREARGDGVACPHLTESRACNTHACPVPCEAAPYGNYSACDPVTRKQNRTRLYTRHGHETTACPSLVEVRACEPVNASGEAAPVWGDFSACSVSCGLGVRTRLEVHGTRVDEEPCEAGRCPCDCVVTAWVEETPCSARCGGGSRFDTRSVVSPSVGGGTPCPELVREVPCNSHPCAIDCAVSGYGAFANCSADCAGGLQARSRVVETLDAHGGRVCPNLTETRDCNVETPCAGSNCTAAAWTSWTACSASCGGGTRTRARTVSGPVGETCPHESVQTRACATQPCPVNCVMAPASAWTVTQTSSTCGVIVTHTERLETTPASGGGTPCLAYDHYAEETHPDGTCMGEECVMVPCTLSAFGEFDHNCTGGEEFQTRTREVETAARHGGGCYEPLYEHRACAAVDDGGDDGATGAGGGLSAGTIAGIAVGAVAGAAAVGGGIYAAVQAGKSGGAASWVNMARVH